MKSTNSVLTLASLFVLGAVAAQADVPLFTVPPLPSSPTNYEAGKPVVLGNEFTASHSFTVTELGFFYDPSLLPITGSEDVGLYDGNGNLLTSATVSASGTAVGDYIWQAITPLTLSAGTYTVAAEVHDNPWGFGGPPTILNGFTYVNLGTGNGGAPDFDRYLYTDTLQYPSNTGGSGPAYYGPNLMVPEPGFYILFALHLFGLLFWIGHRRRA
jgi:hypothetical protein